MTTPVLSVALRIAHGLMAALFGYAVYVQHNDVDPFVWMPVYGIASAFSVLAAGGRPVFSGPALLAAVTLAWGIRMVPGVVGKQSLIDSEEGREMLGLLLVAAWMIVIALSSRRGHAARAQAVQNADTRREETP